MEEKDDSGLDEGGDHGDWGASMVLNGI
jgi:hypothetical protein